GALLPYRDDEGRPLGEEMAPSQVQAGVPMEMRECPYSGSRRKHPHPMNVSSLRQFNQHWPAVVGGLAELRNAYLQGVKRPLDGPINLMDLWKFSRLGIALPAWLLRRAEAPMADGQLPAVTAILYRMLLGINRVAHLQVLIVISAGLYEQMEALDSEVLYEFTDANELFIGMNSVCAGPRGLIEDSFNVLIDGKLPDNADVSEVRALVQPSFLQYGNLLMGMDAQKYIFGASAASLIHVLAHRLSHPGPGEPAPGELAAALEAFQLQTQEQVSSLAREVAAADEEVRSRTLKDLERFRAELAQEQLALSGEALVPPARPGEARLPTSEAVARVMALLEQARPVGPALRPFAEALVEYLELERHHLSVFEYLQARIDRVLGHAPRPPRLGNEDVKKAFGPKLRDFASEFFGAEIHSGAERTVIRLGARELVL
ncbi:MAG TPA: hypothetical protein VF794_00085, partial [Archangium sp.]|uniref:hypothetical protein n=1 Tax=Archangium sp. TaxID=1872627 RepID=UPI002ED90920